MLYADDACIVSWSPRGLGMIMRSSSKPSAQVIWPPQRTRRRPYVCKPIPRAPATQIVFEATGQQYRQATPVTYLGGAVTETPRLSDEIDRQIRAGWVSFKRYKQELYDHPKASLLPLKARMVISDVVEALLYGCATSPPPPPRRVTTTLRTRTDTLPGSSRK